MARTIRCDVAIAGGGLAGGLIALALAARRPDVSVMIVEEGETLGGNHIWSFFDSDVLAADRWLIDPIVAHGWEGYHVLFPKRRRRLPQSYASVHSELLDKAVRAALPADRVLTGCRILGAGARGKRQARWLRAPKAGDVDASLNV